MNEGLNPGAEAAQTRTKPAVLKLPKTAHAEMKKLAFEAVF
jgi:hypothetical protein